MSVDEERERRLSLKKDVFSVFARTVKINLQKLVDIRGYELPTNLQNFTKKRLNWSENIPTSFRGGGLQGHPVEMFGYCKVKIDQCQQQ